MSLRNRRLSEFPNQAQISSYASGDRGPYAVAIPPPPVPTLPAATRQPSNAGRKPEKPTPTYVKAAQRRGDAASGSIRRPDGADDGRRKSRVGEKIKKRLSMRWVHL